MMKKRDEDIITFSQLISRDIVIKFRRAVDSNHEGDTYGKMRIETENALKLHTRRLNKVNKKKN